MSTNQGIVQTGDGAAVVFHAPRQPLPEIGQVVVPAGLTGLPRRPVAHFVGRAAALETLRCRLAAGSPAGVTSQALVGLGGLGKSELALQYASRHRDDYRLVWWIEAASAERVQAGLAGLARALAAGVGATAAAQADAEEAAEWAMAWLSTYEDWLLVLDNVEEPVDVQSLLGRLRHGHVLITTRRDVGWDRFGIAPLKLGALSRPASVDLLTALIHDGAGQSGETLDAVAEELGDLPLALQQAGAYIACTPRMTVTRYLGLLRAHPARMHTVPPVGGETGRVVAQAWTISTARISEINPLAMDLLNLLAFFAPDNLPCTVLAGLAAPHGSDTTTVVDEAQVDEALGLLASYSMITISGASGESGVDLVSVHRLLQAVTFHQLSAEQRRRTRRQAAILLEAALPQAATSMEHWGTYWRLVPHALTVLSAESPGLYRVMEYLGASGNYPAALAVARRLYVNVRNSLGVEHPSSLDLLHEVAYWQERSGDVIAARNQYALLVPVKTRVLGADHPDTLSARHNYARCVGEAGDAATACEQYRALLPIEESILGAEHPLVLLSRHNLADFTGLAGDAVAARDQFAALLPLRVRVSGLAHHHTLAVRHGLAHWTGMAGDAAGARDQFAVLLPLREQVSGCEHPRTLTSRSGLAHWTGEAGNAAAARDQCAELLYVRERVSGTDHPATLLARHDLAHWTGVAGDATQARDQLAALLPVEARVSGARHPDTLLIRHSLARWTGAAGDMATARDQFAALLPVEEEVLGVAHYQTVRTRNALSRWGEKSRDHRPQHKRNSQL
ncbi:tetratricopeptide repeat protein [Nonomuraea sp. NPDC059007]|uniref:tetratricopeptide repeat protein n=1 Tax=Nonomuraea sp. NPDC059007 TaxID=3346692 RepID=UPI0036B1BF5A